MDYGTAQGCFVSLVKSAHMFQLHLISSQKVHHIGEAAAGGMALGADSLNYSHLLVCPIGQSQQVT